MNHLREPIWIAFRIWIDTASILPYLWWQMRPFRRTTEM